MAAHSIENEASAIKREGLLIPVFCIAKIASEVLNKLLIEDAHFCNAASYRLCYITDDSGAALDAIGDRHSEPPIQNLPSPFVGKSIYDLNKFFLDKIKGRRYFAHHVFFVLDEITEETESVIVVETRYLAEITEDDPGIAALRADFRAARQLAMLSDINVEHLLENRNNDKIWRSTDLPMVL